MKTLLKITSKKMNANILSFYYKVPSTEKLYLYKDTHFYGYLKNFKISDLRNILIS